MHVEIVDLEDSDNWQITKKVNFPKCSVGLGNFRQTFLVIFMSSFSRC